MNIRRFFDRLQLECHLRGLHRLAQFFGRFGSPPRLVAEVDFGDRPTLKVPVFVPPEARGSNYSLIDADEPLQVLDFDPTFNNNAGIDVSRDVVFPQTKLDIN